MSESQSKRKTEENDDTVSETSLKDALVYFAKITDRPKFRGNLALALALETIEKCAREHGLSPEAITALVDVAARGLFQQRVSTRLIKALIPATVVPAEAVLKAVSWMCTNQPSSQNQALLIRWLVLVFDALERPSDLHALYGVIFFFLQNEVMCRHVCHLLYLLTRKEDIKMFRVRSLIQLQRKIGLQPYLQGLLSVYKLYNPKSLVVPKTNRIFFRETDRAWAMKVRAVLDRQSVERPLDTNQPHNLSMFAKPSKRQRLDIIPSSLSTRVPLSQSPDDSSIPFAQIQNFTQLLENLDRLELPGQMAAALRDHNLQYVLMCYPDPTIATRIAYWLDHVLCEEFLVNPTKNSARAEDLLQKLIEFSEFLKEGVPIGDFLVKYLQIWNGCDYRLYILKLVTRFRLYHFTALNDLLLEPLRQLYFSSSVYFKAQLISTLTELLQNFVMVELPRYRYCQERQTASDFLSAADSTGCNSRCVFEEEVQEFEPLDTLTAYIEFVGRLAAVGLQTENHNDLLMHFIIKFYDLVSSLHTEYKLPLIVLPLRSVIYNGLLSSNTAILSGVCQLVCRFRQSFVSLRTVESSKLTDSEARHRTNSIQQIKTLNTYVLDFCNALWRKNILTDKDDTSSAFQLVDYKNLKSFTKLKSSAVSQSLSLWQHPATVGFMMHFMKKNLTVHDAEPKDVFSLCKNFREEFLQFLALDHVNGIPEFISTHINRQTTSISSK